ncbi:hypothetical protein CUMW_217580, partial [Citrus unshiu]
TMNLLTEFAIITTPPGDYQGDMPLTNSSSPSCGGSSSKTVKLRSFVMLFLDFKGRPTLSALAILDSRDFDKTAFAAEFYNNNYVSSFILIAMLGLECLISTISRGYWMT